MFRRQGKFNLANRQTSIQRLWAREASLSRKTSLLSVSDIFGDTTASAFTSPPTEEDH